MQQTRTVFTREPWDYTHLLRGAGHPSPEYCFLPVHRLTQPPLVQTSHSRISTEGPLRSAYSPIYERGLPGSPSNTRCRLPLPRTAAASGSPLGFLSPGPFIIQTLLPVSNPHGVQYRRENGECSASWTRTSDLRVMSPASLPTAPSRNVWASWPVFYAAAISASVMAPSGVFRTSALSITAHSNRPEIGSAL